jgi:hypothetical protein
MNDASSASEEKKQNVVALSFKEDSPQNAPVKIQNMGSNSTFLTELSFTDHYDQPLRRGVQTQFVTYLEEDMQIIRDNNALDPSLNKSAISLKLPGSVSEHAKAAGIEIPWEKAITSGPSITLAVSIMLIAAVLTAISRISHSA